jgi:hypothetical protein
MSGASAQESFEISLRGASNIGEDALAAKLLDGFTFEGGYTDTVSKGDGDLTTADTLWDFKVSKAKVKKEYTLQLLMYWRMGLHSVHPEFQGIKYLGIYNPRLNQVL